MPKLRERRYFSSYECLEAFTSRSTHPQYSATVGERVSKVQRLLDCMDRAVTPNKALQTDKGNLSCLLHSQKPRQLASAAELGRWAAWNVRVR
jgi:hypothetical protein